MNKPIAKYKLDECFLTSVESIGSLQLESMTSFDESEIVSFEDAREELKMHVEKLRRIYGRQFEKRER